MASKAKFYFVLFLFLSTFSQIPNVNAKLETNHQHKRLNVNEISQTLASKGYTAMSITLDQMLLKSLIPPNIPTVTIFCPPDKAFLSLKYPQPPLTLLQYHVTPSKLDKEALESSLRLGSRLDTLLSGHPLVVTAIPDSDKEASINRVKIKKWDLYNDGQVIIHGIEDFFPPAYQTLRFPQYDDISSSQSEVKGSSEEGGNYDLLRDVFKYKIDIMRFLLLAVKIDIMQFWLLAVLGNFVLAFFCLGYLYRRGWLQDFCRLLCF